MSEKPPRLFVDAPLRAGETVHLDKAQAHYLGHVMRRAVGDTVSLFNRGDGEFAATITQSRKQGMELALGPRARPALLPPDIDYCFAPLKSARLDYMAQKACEMGVRRLRPVMTQHTVAGRVNLERLFANVVEAAEQCEMTAVPEVLEPVTLDRLIAGWDSARHLVFCDEGAAGAASLAALQAIPKGPLALLVGPEGGFSASEQAMLRKLPYVTVLPLGPRILRADTAAVAALALLQSVAGDWQ